MLRVLTDSRYGMGSTSSPRRSGYSIRDGAAVL